MSAAPQLRGLLKSNLKKHVFFCAGLCVLTVSSFKYFVKDNRMNKYEEFYKHYDAQKDFERMRDVGVFQSVKPKK